MRVKIHTPSYHSQYRAKEWNRGRNQEGFIVVLGKMQESGEKEIGYCDNTQGCHDNVVKHHEVAIQLLVKRVRWIASLFLRFFEVDGSLLRRNL